MGGLLVKIRRVTGRGLLSTSTSLLFSPMQPARCGYPVGVDQLVSGSIRAGLSAHSKVWSKKCPFNVGAQGWPGCCCTWAGPPDRVSDTESCTTPPKTCLCQQTET